MREPLKEFVEEFLEEFLWKNPMEIIGGIPEEFL